MSDSYPVLTRSDEKDAARWRPQGWNGDFYKLVGSLRFTRKELRLSDDLSLVQTQLVEGHIKVGGVINPEGLSISFSEASEEKRVSGRASIEEMMAISYDGAKWDAVIRSPAHSEAIHFSPGLRERIVSPTAHSFLVNKAPLSLGERLSLVTKLSEAGVALRRAIKSSIQLAEEAKDDKRDGMIFRWMSDDLILLATILIDEVTGENHASMARGEHGRYEIAREIEKLLWQEPSEVEGGNPNSLDEFVSYFGCSRRNIQMAVQEQFGVGFVALKRAIRLQQVNKALVGRERHKDIAAAALAYEFEHQSRFSKYYREMFGVLPSRHFVRK
jgi:AraC-like DNA-binding protein